MNCSMLWLCCTLIGVLPGVPTRAEGPPHKLSAARQQELYLQWEASSTFGWGAYQAGKLTPAVRACEEALRTARQLYPESEYPDGNAVLVASLNRLGTVYHAQGKYEAAERLFMESLEVLKRLYKGDHPDVAIGLNNLGVLYKGQGKYAAAEPLYKEALEMWKRLHRGDHPDVATGLNNLGMLYHAQGKYAEAGLLCMQSLEMRKRLYRGDHPDVATSLTNLGKLYVDQGKYAAAELLHKEGLGMWRRLHRGDHPSVATSLTNLAMLYKDQGKYAASEPLFKEALEMWKRLHRGDHPDVATGLNNLAMLSAHQGKYAAAERLHKEVLEMWKRLYKGDHPSVATSLSNLGVLYAGQGKYMAAEPLYKEALEMRKRLCRGDHPDVATSLTNLGALYKDQGKYAAAEPLYKEALEMRKRLHRGDHPSVAICLGNLGALYADQGKYAAAEPLCKEAVQMSYRLTVEYAEQKAEGDVLTHVSSLPLNRDFFISLLRQRGVGDSDPSEIGAGYSLLWSMKGIVARVFEQRQLRARAASVDPALAKVLGELASARRRRAELLLAPALKDPGTIKRREADLQALDQAIAERTEALSKRLPAVKRAERLNAASLADLQNALPAEAAVVDFFRYCSFEQDKDKPGKAGERRTYRYAAFVVTRGKAAWVDLAEAEQVDKAVNAWREAIIRSSKVPPERAAKVRELVWEEVGKQLPAAVKVLYICPDAALCRVPWAAMPGDEPDTILLERYAVATIPHAPFLLDRLLPQDPPKNPPEAALAVGAVDFDAKINAPRRPRPSAGPLMRAGERGGWNFLDGTVGELDGVCTAAKLKKLPPLRLEGRQATTPAVLAALPKARYAHFATHGFFADPSFRYSFDLDEKDFENRFGERMGRVASNPLLMTGLVLAGANDPNTLGRGILTGEQLIDLDLSGLELAVLSACETGLGDVAGGEGVFGLQRAFHYAGASNVVVSLWKVPDVSTAAVMRLFYRNLWEKNLSPLESLRQAQLEVYRNPGRVAELARAFRGKDAGAVKEDGDEKPVAAKSHIRNWAAFTLSGLGR